MRQSQYHLEFFKPSEDLTELLEASLLLAKPEQLWDDDDLERAHAWIELMFLEAR